MSRKYEITIGASTKGGKGASKSTSDLKKQVDASKKMATGQQAKINQKSAQNAHKENQKIVGSNRELQKRLLNLEKEIKSLEKTISQNTGAVKRGGGGTGGGGGTRGGLGGGIGRMGGSLPVVGAVLGALGLAISQVMKIGQAHIQKMEQQISTAGVAGTQYSTGKFLRANEMGQMIKEQRMAAGRFDVGGRGGKNNKRYDAAETYSALFGIGGGEIGKTMGLMQRTSGKSGSEQFSRILDKSAKSGLQTQIPVLMQAMSGTLEDAVKMGVNNSDLAEDMADSVNEAARTNPQASIQSILATQQNVMGMQKQAAMGRNTGLGSFMMNRLAQQNVMEMVKGGGKGKFSKSYETLKKQGMITDEMQKRIDSGGELSSSELNMLSKAYLANQPKELRDQYSKNIMDRFGGEGTESQRRSRAFTMAQSYGLFGNELTAQQFLTEAKTTEARQTGKIPGEDEGQGLKALEKRTKGGAFATRTKELGVENVMLGKTGQNAANTVYKINESFVNLAKSMDSTVATSISGLNDVIIGLGDSIDSTMKRIKAAQKGSVWDFFTGG